MGLMAPEPVLEVIVRQYEDGRTTVRAASLDKRDASNATHVPRVRALMLWAARGYGGPEHLT